MNIVMRDPAKLHLHPLRRNFPKIDTEAPDWLALSKSVNAGGVQQPILIVEPNLIVDGHWRWQAAKDWQQKEIPCLVVRGEDAGWIIAESLLCRKQMTRGAAAYLVMPLIKEAIQSGEHRRLKNLQLGRVTTEIELKPQHFSMSSNWTAPAEDESIRGLCSRWGIGKTAFYQARNIWLWLNESDLKAFKKLHADMGVPVPAQAELAQLQSDLKDDFEPQLLRGEKNLWNVESGIKGRLTGGAHEPSQKQLELFGDALDSLATRAARFAAPEKAAPEIRKWIATIEEHLPVDECVTRLEQVAATCDVTRKTIEAWLKARQVASNKS